MGCPLQVPRISERREVSLELKPLLVLPKSRRPALRLLHGVSLQLAVGYWPHTDATVDKSAALPLL